MEYTYNFLVNISALDNIIRSDIDLSSNLITLYSDGLNTIVRMDSDIGVVNKQKLDTLVTANQTVVQASEQIKAAVNNAITFGNQIVVEFIVENVMLGITQLGLTSHVRKVTAPITSSLTTGSLYDAINEIVILNSVDFDSVIITPARILAFRNKIETYLKIPLATAWNQPVV